MDLSAKDCIVLIFFFHWKINLFIFKKCFFFCEGDTRLGLMWTCMTIYNRPQICFTPDLQPEWVLALVCIFVGCICITTTIILLISSHWDRNVVPYARWVGFTASELSICVVFIVHISTKINAIVFGLFLFFYSLFYGMVIKFR